MLAQITGGIIGVITAHFMFDMDILDASTKVRAGPGQWMGDFVATFGLFGTILACLIERLKGLCEVVESHVAA